MSSNRFALLLTLLCPLLAGYGGSDTDTVFTGGSRLPPLTPPTWA